MYYCRVVYVLLYIPMKTKGGGGGGGGGGGPPPPPPPPPPVVEPWFPWELILNQFLYFLL